MLGMVEQQLVLGLKQVDSKMVLDWIEQQRGMERSRKELELELVD